MKINDFNQWLEENFIDASSIKPNATNDKIEYCFSLISKDEKSRELRIEIRKQFSGTVYNSLKRISLQKDTTIEKIASSFTCFFFNSLNRCDYILGSENPKYSYQRMVEKEYLDHIAIGGINENGTFCGLKLDGLALHVQKAIASCIDSSLQYPNIIISDFKDYTGFYYSIKNRKFVNGICQKKPSLKNLPENRLIELSLLGKDVLIYYCMLFSVPVSINEINTIDDISFNYYKKFLERTQSYLCKNSIDIYRYIIFCHYSREKLMSLVLENELPQPSINASVYKKVKEKIYTLKNEA